MARGYSIVLAMFLAALVASSEQCYGQASPSYPSKSIRIVVPFPPGSAAEQIARLMANDMSGTLRVAVVVESRPGASGNIALDAVAKAPGDGHTLVLASASMAINKSLIKATPFDPQRDFTPISLVAIVPSVLVVSKSLAANSVPELIALAKAQPRSLNYGSTGVGTTQHFAASLFGLRNGVELVHVPYKGADQLVPDLVGGRIQLSFNNVASVQGQLNAGGVRALAIGRDRRLPGMPQVPTYAEAGIGGLEYSGWVALFGPAGLTPQVVESLHRTAVAALRNPTIRDKIEAAGNDAVGGTPAELARFLAAEIDSLGRAVAAAGLRSE